jgi:uncharacterized membrane protein
MNALLTYMVVHAHGAIIHFPIALLIVSIVLDLAARNSTFLHRAAWLSLLIGTVATIPATITGLIAHLPYEESPKLAVIEQHQFMAFATTAAFVALTVWRWRVRRRGKELGGILPYRALAVLAIGLLVLTWYNGGVLVHVHGIGVTGVAP